MRHGAVFEVDAALVVQGLKAIGALPVEAVCYVANEDSPLLIKVLDESGEHLPEVPEATVYTRRTAKQGCPWGEKKRSGFGPGRRKGADGGD